MINGTGTVGAGLVVDNKCTAAQIPTPPPTGSTPPPAGSTSPAAPLALAAAAYPGDCLTALIDTSGGSDDGFEQSATNSVVQAWVYGYFSFVPSFSRSHKLYRFGRSHHLYSAGTTV